MLLIIYHQFSMGIFLKVFPVFNSFTLCILLPLFWLCGDMYLSGQGCCLFTLSGEDTKVLRCWLRWTSSFYTHYMEQIPCPSQKCWHSYIPKDTIYGVSKKEYQNNEFSLCDSKSLKSKWIGINPWAKLILLTRYQITHLQKFLQLPRLLGLQ